MNTNTYAVMANENTGGLPTVVSQNSVTFLEMQMIGYCTLHTGTKRDCNYYLEELMSQLIDIQYFA